ncbi:MAG: hypothetical protein FJ388_13425 [Verrucomicrobia bacterium]|nr:hypothetical protein [Verrucomicrobiota bacterium]
MWDSAGDGGRDVVFDVMVKLFTAYTQPRGLLILRLQARNGGSPLREIAASISSVDCSPTGA